MPSYCGSIERYSLCRAGKYMKYSVKVPGTKVWGRDLCVDRTWVSTNPTGNAKAGWALQ
jgi:hypothetical protein